ncbi:CILP2 [Branchiostoma lanceolatum]|uniref:CILP2 protein n=1 Tax=Branchiostoma lanceolatum TaxID=7740 RepID=A0A8K0F3W3_BRALA|nr:CILP2 [Branchiostoma lanceolatum]
MALKLLLIVGLVFLVGRAATADASAVMENLVETLEDLVGEEERSMDEQQGLADNLVQEEARGSDGWTHWFDRDNPLPTADNEALCEHRIENPGEICRHPSGIQARVKGSNTPATQTSEYFVKFSPLDGLVCRDAHQLDGRCEDYEVRYWCP